MFDIARHDINWIYKKCSKQEKKSKGENKTRKKCNQ